MEPLTLTEVVEQVLSPAQVADTLRQAATYAGTCAELVAKANDTLDADHVATLMDEADRLADMIHAAATQVAPVLTLAPAPAPAETAITPTDGVNGPPPAWLTRQPEQQA